MSARELRGRWRLSLSFSPLRLTRRPSALPPPNGHRRNTPMPLAISTSNTRSQPLAPHERSRPALPPLGGHRRHTTMPLAICLHSRGRASFPASPANSHRTDYRSFSTAASTMGFDVTDTNTFRSSRLRTQLPRRKHCRKLSRRGPAIGGCQPGGHRL